MDREIILEFIDTETGQVIEVKVSWLATTTAVAYYEKRGWELYKKGEL